MVYFVTWWQQHTTARYNDDDAKEHTTKCNVDKIDDGMRDKMRRDDLRWLCRTTMDDDEIWWHATMHDDDVQRHHATMNCNRWRQRWLLSAAGSCYCKPRFANLLILPTYDFNLNDMQSTVISIMCHGACHTAWHPNVWHPKALS